MNNTQYQQAMDSMKFGAGLYNAGAARKEAAQARDDQLAQQNLQNEQWGKEFALRESENKMRMDEGERKKKAEEFIQQQKNDMRAISAADYNPNVASQVLSRYLPDGYVAKIQPSGTGDQMVVSYVSEKTGQPIGGKPKTFGSKEEYQQWLNTRLLAEDSIRAGAANFFKSKEYAAKGEEDRKTDAAKNKLDTGRMQEEYKLRERLERAKASVSGKNVPKISEIRGVINQTFLKYGGSGEEIGEGEDSIKAFIAALSSGKAPSAYQKIRSLAEQGDEAAKKDLALVDALYGKLQSSVGYQDQDTQKTEVPTASSALAGNAGPWLKNAPLSDAIPPPVTSPAANFSGMGNPVTTAKPKVFPEGINLPGNIKKQSEAKAFLIQKYGMSDQDARAWLLANTSK